VDDEEESIEDAIKREVAQAKKPKGGKKFLPLMTGTDCGRFLESWLRVLTSKRQSKWLIST